MLINHLPDIRFYKLLDITNLQAFTGYLVMLGAGAAPRRILVLLSPFSLFILGEAN